MGSIKLAVADAAITCVWVAYIAFIGRATELIVSTLNLQGFEFDIGMGLLTLNIFLFSWVGGVLGGALWNPAPVFALSSMWAAGAVGGVLAAREVVPSSHREQLRGPHLPVDLTKGFLSELILTFLITSCVLVAIFKGLKSKSWKNWIVFATVVVIVLGGGHTRPSLNPAHWEVFAWAYVNNSHSNLEHLLVHWLASLAGSFIAVGTFQLIFRKSRPEEKAA